jgi:hypothetical protein
MLFEAGRASAQTVYRGRILMLASAALLVFVGLGISLARERSERQERELVLAGLERTRSSPPSDSIPSVWIAWNDDSPYSYRALSQSENLSEHDDRRPAAGASQPDGAAPGPRIEPLPLRVRDMQKVLPF